MPFMDGYQCSKIMRRILREAGLDSYEKRPRILAITGHVEVEYQV